MYLSFSVIVSAFFYFFNLSSNSVVNIVILLGSIYYACESFAKTNHRYFTDDERKKVIIGLITIDYALIFTLGSIILFLLNLDVPISIYLIAFLIDFLLHGISIYFFVNYLKKILIKNGIITD